MHLGPFPLEKIKRVDKPTTLITDAVEQVPKRAGFFMRAYQLAIWVPAHRRKSAASSPAAERGDRGRPLEAGAGHKGETPAVRDDPKALAEHGLEWRCSDFLVAREASVGDAGIRLDLPESDGTPRDAGTNPRS